MTLSTRAARFAAIELVAGWAGPVAMAGALAGIVAARLVASRAGLDALLVGGTFGAAVAALAVAGSPRGPRSALRTARLPAVRSARFPASSLAIGVTVGLGLAALTILGPAISGATYVPGLGRPAAPFAPWLLITVVVATAEEAVLRGVLFDRIERVAGLAPAILATTAAFALMHVPVYGWHVVPLDFAVGLVLAGLRIGTRGLAAPIAAHAVADVVTWWL